MCSAFDKQRVRYSCTTYISPTVSRGNTQAHWFLWAALEVSRDKVHSCTRYRRHTRTLVFANSLFFFFLARMSRTRREWNICCMVTFQIAREIHFAQLHRLFLRQSKGTPTLLLLWVQPFAYLVTSNSSDAQRQSSSHLKQNFESFFIDWNRFEVLSATDLSSVSFWICEILSYSLCI
jgi:hypothetical protein